MTKKRSLEEETSDGRLLEERYQRSRLSKDSFLDDQGRYIPLVASGFYDAFAELPTHTELHFHKVKAGWVLTDIIRPPGGVHPSCRAGKCAIYTVQTLFAVGLAQDAKGKRFYEDRRL